MFFEPVCRNRYYRIEKNGLEPLKEWGGFLPEVRKVLQSLQNTGQISLAKQLATAIDREYEPRRRGKEITPRSGYVTCRCKMCRSEFRRLNRGQASREYCDTCLSSMRKKSQQGEDNPAAKLTQAQADKIRQIRSTQHLSCKKIGEIYGVSEAAIRNIVIGKTYISRTPVDMSERRSGENSHTTKLSWEKVDEIRNLQRVEHLSYTDLAKKYSVSLGAIKHIIEGHSWKPEHDPRRKSESAGAK